MTISTYELMSLGEYDVLFPGCWYKSDLFEFYIHPLWEQQFIHSNHILIASLKNFHMYDFYFDKISGHQHQQEKLRRFPLFYPVPHGENPIVIKHKHMVGM